MWWWWSSHAPSMQPSRRPTNFPTSYPSSVPTSQLFHREEIMIFYMAIILVLLIIYKLRGRIYGCICYCGGTPHSQDIELGNLPIIPTAAHRTRNGVLRENRREQFVVSPHTVSYQNTSPTTPSHHQKNNGINIIYTNHARERMEERHINEREVRYVLLSPDNNTCPTLDGKAKSASLSGIRVIYNINSYDIIVITVYRIT